MKLYYITKGLKKEVDGVVYVRRRGCNLFYQFADGGSRHCMKCEACVVVDSYGVMYEGRELEVNCSNVITF